MLDFFYSFQPPGTARLTNSSVFLSSLYLDLKTHFSPFAAFLPFIWQGYHTLTGFLFLMCHLAMISMTACFIQWSIKPLEKTQEKISACERQSWGREGTKRFGFILYFIQGEKGQILLSPLGVYLMIGATCSTSIIP